MKLKSMTLLLIAVFSLYLLMNYLHISKMESRLSVEVALLLIMVEIVMPICSIIFAVRKWHELKLIALVPTVLAVVLVVMALEIPPIMEEHIVIKNFKDKFTSYERFIKQRDKLELKKVGPNAYMLLPSGFASLSKDGMVSIHKHNGNELVEFHATRGRGPDYVFSSDKKLSGKAKEIIGDKIYTVKEIGEGWYYIKK